MVGTILTFAYLIWNIYCFLLMLKDRKGELKESLSVAKVKKLALLFGGFGISFGFIVFYGDEADKRLIRFSLFGVCLNVVCLIALVIIYTRIISIFGG
ncbi:MAG: hypothetical protein IJR47_04325 [Clostridia bacterium]|nr:hypothetical protein [Clostridia bacterium]